MSRIVSIRAKNRFTPAAAAALLTMAVLFIMPKAAAQGCADGIELCMSTAIPSLFPMMFATVLSTETGLTQLIGRITAPVTRRLFTVSDEAGGAVLMAVIGGFPAGAKAVNGLLQHGTISREEAEKMYLFCFAAGPAFLLGMTAKIYGSAKYGAALLVIQIVSVIATGWLIGLFAKKKEGDNSTVHETVKTAAVSIPEAITRAVVQSASAMLNICLYIILFSVLRAILDQSGITSLFVSVLTAVGVKQTAAEAVIPILLEVTAGCTAAVRVGFCATAFAVGFGGLAVHMQILAIAGGSGFRYGRFLLARLIQGTISALLARLYLVVVPVSAVAASADTEFLSSISTTPAGAVVLVVMSVMFLMCIPKVEKVVE